MQQADTHGWRWSGWHQHPYFDGEVGFWQKLIGDQVYRQDAMVSSAELAIARVPSAIKDATRADALGRAMRSEAAGFPSA